MVKLPQHLLPFETKAKEMERLGLVKEVEFSGSTYQIHVLESESDETGYWSFLQLNEKGGIEDLFCTCEEVTEEGNCVHAAAAYLHIYGNNSYPLHLRFEGSLWNALCRLYADKIGYDPEELKRVGPEHYTFASITGKRLFEMEALDAKGRELVRKWIEERTVDTEETSLKFSNLSEREIVLWREGRPSPKVLYRLSFWNDFAKWAMIQQVKGIPYEIDFDGPQDHLPNQIRITFPSLAVAFYLSEANLPTVIPTLKDVNSPLSVYTFAEEKVAELKYDEDKGVIHVKHRSSPEKEFDLKKVKGISLPTGLSDWIYLSGVGFYKKERDGFLSRSTLQGIDISNLLNEHFELAHDLLSPFSVHEKPVELSYHLFFDAHWNLHIQGYLFERGDLLLSKSRYFHDWVFLEGDGFYRLLDKKFHGIDLVIPERDVDHFVSENRVWLSSQHGFQPHYTQLETELTYSFDLSGALVFDTASSLVIEETRTQRDFGTWIFIAEQGFFSKVRRSHDFPVSVGTRIPREQIPLFIHMQRQELALVPDFFADNSPIEKAFLSLQLKEGDTLQVIPGYHFKPEYENKSITFFEDYVYVEGEGFSQIPYDQRLPDEMRHPVELRGEERDFFLSQEIEAFKEFIQIDDQRLKKQNALKLDVHQIDPLSEMGKGWYQFQLDYQTDKGSLPIALIWEALSKGKRFLFTEAGMLDLEEPQFHWLRHLAKGRMNRENNAVVLSTMELMRLSAAEELTSTEKSTRDMLESMTQFKERDLPKLSGFKSILRSYQEIGVKWLWHLYQNNLSGLLCDDMGLGKTHQSMAFIAALLNENSSEKKHFLIVCPTSVLYHWEEKIKQYLPLARVLRHHGTGRSLAGFYQNYDLLLTSFGVLRKDISQIAKMDFALAIYDEIQVAKNHTSLMYHALTKVQAGMRLGLTGTPIENHLRELKSLYDLVLPGFLPGEKSFREYFLKPIEKGVNSERRNLLSKLIKPFLLRRKKEEVLDDLPEKIEEVAHCGLSDEQKRLYGDTLMLQREKLYEVLQNRAMDVPYLHIFALLSSLKQICNHPALFHKSPEAYASHASGKWDLFVELLSEARESRQKVVIFTQYLGMLDIFEQYLSENAIGHVTIRGSTTKRGERLKTFNTDPACEVFLGSIQAVGLGVDLTAASVVIHYDRWWNAARENQATDRVHRIGQTRGVQVFKLVTKNTFEERIDDLITKKGTLMEEVVGTDQSDIVKSFSREELIELLQFSD